MAPPVTSRSLVARSRRSIARSMGMFQIQSSSEQIAAVFATRGTSGYSVERLRVVVNPGPEIHQACAATIRRKDYLQLEIGVAVVLVHLGCAEQETHREHDYESDALPQACPAHHVGDRDVLSMRQPSRRRSAYQDQPAEKADAGKMCRHDDRVGRTPIRGRL